MGMEFDYNQFATALANALSQNRPSRADRIAETALKGMGHQPTFKAGTNFRQFEVSYRVWRGNVGLDTTDANGTGIVPPDVQAKFLINSFKEEPALRINTIAQGTVPWNQTILNAAELDPNRRFESFFDLVRRLFLPEGESRMARVEFMKYRQKPDQNMSAYVTNKIALWENAYTNARTNHFQLLLDETIKGTGNMVIKRELRKSVITTPEDLRDRAINLVAIERQCMDDGSSESTSYDYLTPVSVDSVVHGDVMMDDSLNAFGDKSACRRCGKNNHFAANCTTPWKDIKKPAKPSGKGSGNSQNQGGNNAKGNNTQNKKPKYPPNNPAHKNLICNWCQIRGHVEQDCRGKMAGKPKKPKNPANNTGNRGRGALRTMDGNEETPEDADATDPFLVEDGETH